MKKLLACTLATLLILGCAFGAAAVDAEIDSQGLQYTLPVVTGIEAEWNGEILLSSWLEPQFSPDNVTITVSFEEGDPEVLTHWHEYGNIWWWSVSCEFDGKTGVVTFRYDDSSLRQVFYDADPGEDWNAYRASLPQASFAFPLNYVEQYIDSYRPLTELEFKQVTAATGCHIFQFTPTKSGAHNFVFEGSHWDEYSVQVLNANYERIFGGWVEGNFVRSLLAGETYYIIIVSYSEREYRFVITDDLSQGGYSRPQPNWWERFFDWTLDLTWFLGQSLFGRLVLIPLIPVFVAVRFIHIFYYWTVYGDFPF